MTILKMHKRLYNKAAAAIFGYIQPPCIPIFILTIVTTRVDKLFMLKGALTGK